MREFADTDEDAPASIPAAERLVRAYYEAIDADEYDRLAALLDSRFVHYRPDRTIDGRDRFVTFMREERPDKNTTHVVERVYTDGGLAATLDRPDGAADGAATLDGSDGSAISDIADGPAVDDEEVDDEQIDDALRSVTVQGRLLDATGGELFEYVDVFRIASDDPTEESGTIRRLETHVASSE